jgi:flagellar motor switch protein FliM
MSAASPAIAAHTASLVRIQDANTSFPGMDRIGENFARGLRRIIAGFGGDDALVNCDPVNITTYGALRTDNANATALLRVNLEPIRGDVLMIIPSSLIRQLVDIFYGGDGVNLSAAATQVSGFTASEDRFLERIGLQCLPIFKAAWNDIAYTSPDLTAVYSDIAAAAFAPDHDLIVVQTFSISGGVFGEAQILCAYTTAGLRSFPALLQSVPVICSSNVDPVWRDKLTDAVMQLHLPVRSIFARPELPVAELLTLKAGDIIPIFLPPHLPLTVAGRLFAYGTVGNSGSRAAIRIEKIAEGNNQNE